MTRAFDKHLDSDELDRLVTLQWTSVSDSEQVSEQDLGEAQRHVESCQDCGRKVQIHKSAQGEILRMRALNPSPPTPECIGDVEWLEVAAGLLADEKIRELMKHAAQCGICGPLLKSAAEMLTVETTPSEETLLASLNSARPEWQKSLVEVLRRSTGPTIDSRELKKVPRWWNRFVLEPRRALVFVGIAVVAIAGWLGSRMLRPPAVEQLLAQAYTEHRTLEVRIPGAKYAPMRVERNASASNLDKSASLLKAEALIGENLGKNPNDPTWLQDRARADLLDGNYDSAIRSLQRALEARPDSPQLLTDLASAYFERAEMGGGTGSYGDAIESLGKALDKSPDDPVALFNRALISERMFSYAQAVDDWKHYLRIDPTGEWADDARRRFAALQEKLKQHNLGRAEPLLSPSEMIRTTAESGTLNSKVDFRIEDYLNLAVTEWLPEAYVRPQRTHDSAELRTALHVLAEISSRKHGDKWMADILLGASAPNFLASAGELSRAVKANETGDNVAAARHARQAERFFTTAGNDAGASRARVEYLFALHDAQEGAQCLEAAKGHESRLREHPYHWLTVQFHIEQATCNWLAGDLGGARQLYEKAAREAEASGYRTIYLRTQDHLSSLYGATGNLAEGWATTQRALSRFWSGNYPEMRGYNLYYNLYEIARIAKQPYLQMAVWRDGIALSENSDDPVIRAMAHSLMASAAIAAKQPNTATEELTRARQLFAVAPQIKSTRIARSEAVVRLAEVETADGRPQYAISRLRQLEPEIAQLSDNFLAIFFYTSLANAESAIEDGKGAELALASALAASELQLLSLRDDQSRVEWSQRASNSYRNLVQFRLRQGDVYGALEIWEWYQGSALRAGRKPRSTLPPNQYPKLPEPRQVAIELPRLTRETVVSYALLPRGLAIWVFDDRGVFIKWTEANPSDIAARAKRFRNLCSDPRSDLSDLTRNARELYGLLVTPIEQYLSANRTLITELDGELSGIPLDALMDGQNRYLGERGPMMSSLGIYYRQEFRPSGPITAGNRALVVAAATSNAAFYSSIPPLPDAMAEGEMVAHDFDTAHLLTGNDATTGAVLSQLPNVSVFHFAGHANSSQPRSGLLLSNAWLNASLLKGTSLSQMQLAVFSACDTQDGTNGGASSADSLVRFFLRAGVAHVVASRWNVDSSATRQFMESFYRNLLAGKAVADSLSEAQSQLRTRPGMSHPYYWAAFTAFGAV